jgi:regulator of replication initiation timing
LITDPQRVLPVYLLTEADARRLPGKVRQYVLDEHRLAERTLGLAHVAVLARGQSFAWTNRVGKVWSAFQGAVRTYRPGLNFETDSPFADHPLAMAENIIFMRYKSLAAEEAFLAFLADRAHQESATRQVDWGGCLFFTDARRHKAEIVRREATEKADWKAIYEDQITILEQKIQELEKERDEMMDLVDQADKDRDYYRAENENLRWQVESLRAQLAHKTGEDPDTSIEIPEDYDDLPDWVSKNLAARLVLHPRAIRAVKDASYQNVQLVYRGLLLLANEYRSMRLHYPGAKQAFEKQRDALNVECSPSITWERAGEEGDTYFVQYPSHTANRRFLEWHIRKGKTKDDRHCLAIYFFWDDETRQVVVGWLPSHLGNRLT